MKINEFLVCAGMPTCQEDLDYLESVKESFASKYIDFNKYYWVTPIVRFKIINEIANSIKDAKFMAEEDLKMYAYYKAKAIDDKLNEDHEFLMQIKDMELEEYVSRYHFESIFDNAKFNYNLVDLDSLSKEGFEHYVKKRSDAYTLYTCSFEEMKRKAKVITVSAIAVLLLQIVKAESILPPIVSCIAIALAIFQDIKISRFKKKGLKDEL